MRMSPSEYILIGVLAIIGAVFTTETLILLILFVLVFGATPLVLDKNLKELVSTYGKVTGMIVGSLVLGHVLALVVRLVQSTSSNQLLVP